MKRTCLQKETNTYEQNSCEFHPANNLFKEQPYYSESIQYVKNFVQMKKLTMILLLMTIIISSVFASGYNEEMIKNIERLNKSQDATELAAIANTFEHIAQKETGEWLPVYYSAYATISTTFFNVQMSSVEKIKVFDKAQQLLDKAKEIAENEDEIFVLQAMLLQLKISVDPNNAHQYIKKSEEELVKAETIDAKNPRIQYLRGLSLFYTPAEYGGGPSMAKPLLENAAKLFTTADTTNQLMPNWGAYHNNMMLGQCSGAE